MQVGHFLPPLCVPWRHSKCDSFSQTQHFDLSLSITGKAHTLQVTGIS